MEAKIREKAKIAMRGILEAAGYEVEEVDSPLDLSAVRDGDCLLVLCTNDQAQIEEFDKTNYCLMVGEEEKGCKKILFTLEDPVSAPHCIVWGVPEFVRYAGEAALAKVMARQLSLSLTREERVPAQESAQAEAPSGITLSHFPVKVTKQAAERIAGVSGTATLRFMPHWLFSYVSSGEQVYKDHHVPFDAEGAGAINAINGLRVEADTKDLVEGDIPQGSDVVKPRISKEDASERVAKDLIEQLTREVRIKQVKGDAIFYEEKVVKPDPKNINIELKQVYIPVWQIRGKKIVEINAFSGEILSEPMDEGVEVF